MNIGILIPGFSANERDWCVPVYLDYIRELSRLHHVRVYPIRYPFTSEPYEVYGAQVYPFNGGSHTAGLLRWPLLRKVEQTIKRHHKERPFHVLHAIWADETGYLANRIGEDLGVPTVVSVAGGELVGYRMLDYGLQLGPVSSRLVYKALHDATVIVAPCRYSTEMTFGYLKYHEIDQPLRLHRIPLGVDTKMFKLPPLDSGSRSREFLHVGSLTPVKRQDVLLHMIARMPGAHLDIVGDGKLRGQLEELAARLNITDRVIFHGDVRHDLLPAYYQTSNWLLMTSQHEAFCMAAVEALACGTGVIGTAVGVLPEVGRVAQHRGLYDLLEAVVARQRGDMSEERAKRRQLVEEHFSLKRMVAGLVEVYEFVVQKGR